MKELKTLSVKRIVGKKQLPAIARLCDKINKLSSKIGCNSDFVAYCTNDIHVSTFANLELQKLVCYIGLLLSYAYDNKLLKNVGYMTCKVISARYDTLCFSNMSEENCKFILEYIKDLESISDLKLVMT